ncbi:hypothetical protein BRYFOR_05910 [Marvinbryantia formatexigens DSM 14469]|uniref:Uncharacterized protein n=1 Tax=Marvinbryantia formatexigens DSM 14469 TaxID=478749 RepID=C6LBB5_9FIRM|nr:hypothetical protein BRYFOR_05910 [Marvinbryantia formatexigens DSM 14469]
MNIIYFWCFVNSLSAGFFSLLHIIVIVKNEVQVVERRKRIWYNY